MLVMISDRGSECEQIVCAVQGGGRRNLLHLPNVCGVRVHIRRVVHVLKCERVHVLLETLQVWIELGQQVLQMIALFVSRGSTTTAKCVLRLLQNAMVH